MNLFIVFGVGAVVSALTITFLSKRGISPILGLAVGAGIGAVVAFKLQKRGT